MTLPPQRPVAAGGPAVVAGLPGYLALHAGRALEAVTRTDGDLSVELVHDARTSLRRLRATLRTLPDLVEDEEAVEASLQHLALRLGTVRDADVLEELFAEALDRLAADGAASAGFGMARALLRTTLARLRRRAVDACLREAEEPTWTEGVAVLRGFVEEPPEAPVVEAEAVLGAAERRTVERLRAADGEVAALHAARKAAKRWRYAAELLEDVPTAATHLERAQHLQELLGQVQDLEIALELLVQLRGRAGGAQRALEVLGRTLRARQRDAIGTALTAGALAPIGADPDADPDLAAAEGDLSPRSSAAPDASPAPGPGAP